MKNCLKKSAMFLVLLFALCACPAFSAQAGTVPSVEGKVFSAALDGTVGVSMENFVTAVLTRAEEEKGGLVIFRLDTPGGLVSSMRAITAAILESSVPVVVWVSPQGARAGPGPSFSRRARSRHGPRNERRRRSPVMASGQDAPDKEMKSGRSPTIWPRRSPRPAQKEERGSGGADGDP